MVSEFERLQAALPRRYTLLRELDRGGMSRVYMAREALPDRDVAIKVFDEHLSARLGRERFVREVELTSQLSHPHIVPIYAAGEADGTLYYVMPFISGESLRDRLAREGTLSISDAMRVVHQVADGLQHAHDKGVVHRDVKPANILFQSGHAVVADFGIARALREAGTGEVTAQGMAVGTPDYMSPEQAIAEGNIDASTDTYALACVLYEMLGGQPPFHSRTPQATLARQLTDTMPSLVTLRSSVNSRTEAAIRRALSKSPADRFRSVTDFADTLQKVESGDYPPPAAATPEASPWTGLGWSLRIVGTLLVVAALGLAWSAWSLPDPMPATATIRYADRVAVRPFDNRTGDPTLNGLGESMADAVTNQLATVPEIEVIGSYSVASLWDDRLGLEGLMDTLKIGHLIDGVLEMRGDSLMMTVREYGNGGVVHNVSTYPVSIETLDSAQLAVAHTVFEQFLSHRGLVAGLQEQDVAYGPGRDAYVAGNSWLGQRTPAGMRRAVTQFTEAIRLEPTYAPALAGLSSAYALGLYYKYDLGMSAYDLAAMAIVSADRAIELDPNLANGFAARGYILALAEIDSAAARVDFDRANELAPNAPNAPSWSSRLLAQRGLVTEAYAEARRARDLDPGQAGRRMALASVAFQLGNYEVVIEESRAALRLQSDLKLATSFEARALAMTGRGAECLALDLGVYELVRALCLHSEGRESEASEFVADADAQLTSSGMGDTDHLDDVGAQDLASYYGLVGDAENSIRWLRRAFEISPTGIESKILYSELFDAVRDHPDFAAAATEVRADALGRIEESRRRHGGA